MTHISPLPIGWKVTAPDREIKFSTRRQAVEWARKHLKGVLVVHGRLDAR